MKIATSELEHLREEVKNCHRIIKDLQKKREFVGLTEEDIDDAEIHLTSCRNNHESWIEGIQEFAQAIEAKLRSKNE